MLADLCALANTKELASQSTQSARAEPTKGVETLSTSGIRDSVRKAILNAIVARIALRGKSATARTHVFSALM